MVLQPVSLEGSRSQRSPCPYPVGNRQGLIKGKGRKLKHPETGGILSESNLNKVYFIG
jgi:hypothetical protein